MPSRHYIAEKGIPALHTKVREQVQRHLKEATSIALTTDLWSSGVAPMSLLSLTAHWIDSSFTLHNVVLHARELRGSHTSMRIRNAIEEMLAKWDIDNDKVHVVMRDNAANMKKAFADMGVQSLGCFAHTLQLVVIQGLLAQRSIIDAVANARKLVGHFKHSPKAYSILEDIQVVIILLLLLLLVVVVVLCYHFSNCTFPPSLSCHCNISVERMLANK
ncbi:hypothetical protein JOQ06_009223 [Pogonophryne albipinna]|uniref:Zinc finger BED domain-containing protein 4 n=1 Tax=Pogonophryne albipinna TaxID=1090488 RepID=A0AAD6BQG8_9TELE|nr:hypothetical protein JOQ06_009223 [Pogonophryne albipinna]